MRNVCDDASAMDELLQCAVREEAAFYAKYDPAKMASAPVSRAYQTRWSKKNTAFHAPRQTGDEA